MQKNKHAQALGKRGGKANTAKQKAARAMNAIAASKARWPARSKRARQMCKRIALTGDGKPKLGRVWSEAERKQAAHNHKFQKQLERETKGSGE